MADLSLPLFEETQRVNGEDYSNKFFNSAWFAPTYRCNSRCEYCYVGGDDNTRDTPLETAKKFITLIRELGAQKITFIGAESTLYPHILELINFTEKSGMDPGIVTNGRRFSHKPFTHEMKSGGLKGAGITVLGDESTNDSITGINGSYRQTIKGIKNCLEEGIDVTLNTTISREAQHCLDYVIDLAETMGIRRVSINVCTDLEGISEHSIKPTEATTIVKDLFKRNKDRWERLRVTTTLPLCNFGRESMEYLEEGLINGSCCVFSGNAFALDYNGDVLPCPHFTGFPYFNILKDGNLIDSGEFKKLFFGGSVANSFRKKIWTFPTEECIKCSANGTCTGGCPIFWQGYDPNQEVKGGFTNEN